jgi:predicted phage terminase large subunit-like protein
MASMSTEFLQTVASQMTSEQVLEFESLRAEYSRRKLLGFTAYCNPLYEPSWHHKRVADELDAVLDGRTKRLMLFMPPQHGKTELASRNLVPLALGKNPDLQVVFGTYNAERAKEVSGDVQSIMESPEYRLLFPGTRLASTKDDEVKNALRFEIVGRRGTYTAAGVGQGITGKSMSLGIIDDPIKGRAEAESEAYRKQVKDWYRADFSTRQMSDQCAIVVIQTRWHTDDLAGWLLKLAQENPELPPWRVVVFPAILEQEVETDPRHLGDALWPQRFSKRWLLARKAESGTYDWSALYQQTPVPPGGAMAQRGWFEVVDAMPSVRRRMRAWDLAATKETAGREPAWTVGTLIAELSTGQYCVEDVVRVRETPGKVDQLMRNTATRDGRHVAIREWEDPGQAGKSVCAAHALMLAGYDYAAVKASGEKTLQWRPLFAQAEAGNVKLLRAAWNNAWLNEMELVPYGLFFDQADSAALAFNEITQLKDKGPTAAVVMPGTQTVGGPPMGAWQEQYFRR